MDNTEMQHLHYFELPYTFVQGTNESLSPEERAWLYGPALMALMNGEKLPEIPPEMSRAIYSPLRTLQGIIDESWGKWKKSRESGSKGGHKKAENAKQKAVENEKNGIYCPPKITAFKQMCADILQQYGDKKISGYGRFPLYLPEKKREILYYKLSSDDWNYSGIKITDENILKSTILVQALYNTEEHYNGEDRELYSMLIEKLRELVNKNICCLGALVIRLSTLVYDSVEGWQWKEDEEDEDQPEEKTTVPCSFDPTKPFVGWGQ